MAYSPSLASSQASASEDGACDIAGGHTCRRAEGLNIFVGTSLDGFIARDSYIATA